MLKKKETLEKKGLYLYRAHIEISFFAPKALDRRTLQAVLSGMLNKTWAWLQGQAPHPENIQFARLDIKKIVGGRAPKEE